MSDYAVQLQPAYVLHYRKYRETSLILDVLTRDFGKVVLLAKGVRKVKSTTVGLLQPFVSLQISYAGKNELKTLTHVELMPPSVTLAGVSLYCAFYLNDLVRHFLHTYDPHPEVFFDYRESLIQLTDNDSIERLLRLFEINLLENVGYALLLDADQQTGLPVDAHKQYQFYVEQGPVENEQGPFSGAMLIALRNRDLVNQQILREAKKLLRSVIDYHLPNKKLKSRALIMQYNKYIKPGTNA